MRYLVKMREGGEEVTIEATEVDVDGPEDFMYYRFVSGENVAGLVAVKDVLYVIRK